MWIGPTPENGRRRWFVGRQNSALCSIHFGQLFCTEYDRTRMECGESRNGPNQPKKLLFIFPWKFQSKNVPFIDNSSFPIDSPTHQNAISWFESNWCLHKIGKYFALLLGFMQLIIRIDQIGQFIDVIQPIEDWNELSGIGESFDSKIQIALPNNVSRKNQNIIMNEFIFILANKTIL